MRRAPLGSRDLARSRSMMRATQQRSPALPQQRKAYAFVTAPTLGGGSHRSGSRQSQCTRRTYPGQGDDVRRIRENRVFQLITERVGVCGKDPNALHDFSPLGGGRESPLWIKTSHHESRYTCNHILRTCDVRDEIARRPTHHGRSILGTEPDVSARLQSTKGA